MFNLIGFGERSGSGIPKIYNVWNKQGWSAPSIIEKFDPERIELLLPLGKNSIKKSTLKTTIQKNAIIHYLTENVEGKITDFEKLLGLQKSRVKELIYALVQEEIIVAEGTIRNKVYKLKNK